MVPLWKRWRIWRAILLLLLLLLLLLGVATAPFYLAFGHTVMPWPLSLVGADAPGGHLAQRVRAHAAALASSRRLTPEQRSHEASVAALAAGLRALPLFAQGRGQLHVCAVASRSEPGLELLQASAAAAGVQVTVLGMGDAALQAWGKGLGRKAVHVSAFVATLPPHDLVLLVDAYDAVFMGPPSLDAYFRGLARAMLREPLDPANAPPGAAGAAAAAAALPPLGLEQLLASRRPPSILFSAEQECMDVTPEQLPRQRALQAVLRFPCLNSGGMLGPAGELHRLLGAIDWARFMVNDQIGFYHALSRSRARSDLPLVVLDHDTEVFLTMFGVEVERDIVQAEGGGWMLAGAPPGARPAVWHFPSYYKRMSRAVELLTGRLGLGGGSALQRCMEIAWAAMAAAFVLGLAAAAACRGAMGAGVADARSK